MDIKTFFKKKNQTKIKPTEATIPPGRVSEPNDSRNTYYTLKNDVKLITPSFRSEVIPLIRDLYKLNPDVGVALQDMFKLANTGHTVTFPYNEDDEVTEMKQHIDSVSNNWTNYTAGINGLVNKLIVQCLVSGAIAIEAVPNKDLTGISTIVFLNPEDILFERSNEGKYQPYQIIKNNALLNKDIIKLNNETFFYVSMYNDTDEPYGIPPFMTALEPLDNQAIQKKNFKTIMNNAGMLGFLEALMTKPNKLASESDKSYASRLNLTLSKFKTAIMDGMSDGVVVGYEDDHKFNLNSTTKDLANMNKPWEMNQQSVANGLGVSSNLIGISTSNTEGGAGIMLSKMISQLRVVQMTIAYVLVKIYSLEMRLAGFNNKGCKVLFGTSTISDELKVQQGVEIKLRNLTTLYQQGIISQKDYAREAGYDEPAEAEPRLNPMDDIDENIKDSKREADKDKSDRKGRDKKKINPKRADQNPKER